MRRWVPAITAFLALGACAQEPPAPPQPLFQAPVALARPLTAATPVTDRVWLLDQGADRIYGFTLEGTLVTTLPLSPPGGRWPLARPRLWRRGPATATVVVTDVARQWLGRIDLAKGTTRWTAYPVSAQLVATTAGVTVATPGMLPADVGRLPEPVGRAYAYLTTDGALAWWDGEFRWRYPAGAVLGPYAFHRGNAAWTTVRRVVTATVGPDGVTAVAWAPLQVPAVELVWGPRRLWLLGVDGSLHAVVTGSEPGILCYEDRDLEGSTVADVRFIDLGALSEVVIDFPRVGRPGCPGWVRTDLWELVYETGPEAWSAVTLVSGLSITEVPYGAWLEPGDAFVVESERWTIVALDPLMFDRPLSTPTEGVLVPRRRWGAFSVQGGFHGWVRGGETAEFVPVAIRVEEGADPPTTGDRIRFTLRSGVTPYRATGRFQELLPLRGDRLALLDPVARELVFVVPGGAGIVRVVR